MVHISHEGRLTPEQEQDMPTIVECIAPQGLGFGEGAISTSERAESEPQFAEKLAFIGDKLMNDSETFKTVEANDDGCGDGRGVARIFQRLSTDGMSEVISFNRSLRRAKVFGGGAAVGASMWRAASRKPSHGETFKGDFSFIVTEFAKDGFAHGAHTDNHAQGDRCGCGAIDNYPVATRNILAFREPITETLKAVYGDEYADNHDAIESVFDAYADLSQDEEYFAAANGKDAMETLLDEGTVVKELDGPHLEGVAILNDVEGTTIDQPYLAEQLAKAFGPEAKQVQAFAVDTWRGRQIAEEIVQIAKRSLPEVDEEHVRRVAYADFMIRTLAVTATLTKGDLPVFRRRAEHELVAVGA